MILGINAGKKKTGLVFSCDFTALPFTDLTCRHAISNTGVTCVGGKAAGFSGESAGLTVSATPKDFSLSGDFEISVTVNATSAGITSTDKSIFKVDQTVAESSEYLELYRHRHGYLVVVGSGTISTFGTYNLPMDTDVILTVRRVGSTLSLLANGVSKGSTTFIGVIKGRQLRIGGYVLGGYSIQWYGTIDDFTWTNS